MAPAHALPTTAPTNTCASITRLAGESPETIAKLAQTYASHFRPANAVEVDLVREMVAARLQMRRCSTLLERFVDLETQSIPGSPSYNLSALDPSQAKSRAFHGITDNSNAIRLLSRYARRALRAHLSAFRRLLKIRATAKAKLPIEPDRAALPLSVTPPASDEELPNEPDFGRSARPYALHFPYAR